jgi:hypothetical protein
MLNKNSLIITTFAVATLLVSAATSSVYAAILSLTCQTKIVTQRNEKK